MHTDPLLAHVTLQLQTARERAEPRHRHRRPPRPPGRLRRRAARLLLRLAARLEGEPTLSARNA